MTVSGVPSGVHTVNIHRIKAILIYIYDLQCDTGNVFIRLETELLIKSSRRT